MPVIQFDSEKHDGRTVSYLEKLVSGYWKIYATTIFADTCIDPNFLLDLLCSSVLEACGHGRPNGDRDDVPSVPSVPGVILGGGRGGWSRCVRARLCSPISLGGHAVLMMGVTAGANLSGSHATPGARERERETFKLNAAYSAICRNTS